MCEGGEGDATRAHSTRESHPSDAAVIFPAPRSDAKGNPDRWGQMEVEHVNKVKLRRWSLAPSIDEASMPSTDTFFAGLFTYSYWSKRGTTACQAGDGPEFLLRWLFAVRAGRTRAASPSGGVFGTHLHAVWSILTDGLQASGPDTPGARYFEITHSDGSVVPVSGVYCFKQELKHKCLFYSTAVLLGAVPGGTSGSRPLAIRTVFELKYMPSDVNKRGKSTDQTILKSAQLRALHVQLVQAHKLELGTRVMPWNPAQIRSLWASGGTIYAEDPAECFVCLHLRVVK